MDFYISRYTLNKLDNVLNNYKKKILRDFHKINELSIDYQTFENSILERTIKKPIIKNKTQNIDKCHAYVWKKNYGKVQCNNSIKTSRFCKMHALNQNYGIINIYD
jgi:hypothetical protein